MRHKVRINKMSRCTYFVVFLALVPAVLCCGKTNIVLQEANTKCPDGSTSVFQLSPDFGYTLTDDCVLQPTGCAEMTKNISVAKAQYKLSTAVVPLTEDSDDVCALFEEATKNKDILVVLNMFSFPKSCPIPQNKVCSEGKTISLSEYKAKIEMLAAAPGTIKGEAVIDHGPDGKSCLNFVMVVSPKPIPFT